jgi:hypothetical protein
MKKHLIILIMLCSVLPAQRQLEPTFIRRQIDMDTAKVLKTLLIPTGAVSGYFLKSDGRGRASWAPATASAAWGAITGTLSAQTDLSTALNGKQAAIANLGDTLKYAKKTDTTINREYSDAKYSLKAGSSALTTLGTVTAGTWNASAIETTYSNNPSGIDAGTNITITSNGGKRVKISAAGGGSAAWGSITGSLSSQTDLVAELAGKQATIGNIGDTTKYLKKADTVRIDFNDKREMQYLKNPGAATGIVSGLTAPTLSGSQLSADDAFGPWLKHTTTAISGNAVGFVSAFTVMRSDWKPEMIIKVQLDTAAVTSVRYWAGMYSGSVDASSAPNVHGALFRYATDADGTVYWRCVTIAGTGASAQITTTTVPVAINIPYKLHIKNETTVVYFYINNQLVATHSSVVPTATQLMGWGARVVTLGAVKHNIRWSNVILLHN